MSQQTISWQSSKAERMPRVQVEIRSLGGVPTQLAFTYSLLMASISRWHLLTWSMMLWSRDATALCLVAKYNVNFAGSINSMQSLTCLELDVWSGIVEIVWIDSVASKSHMRKLPDKVSMPGSAAERNLRWHKKHCFELYCHVLVSLSECSILM